MGEEAEYELQRAEDRMFRDVAEIMKRELERRGHTTEKEPSAALFGMIDLTNV